MGIQCHSALLPSACCQVAASPAKVPVAKLHGCQKIVENAQKVKGQHLSCLSIPLTCSNSKQVASMCQIAQLQVAKCLMPRALLPSARCQVPVPSVPSLCLLANENSRQKTISLFKLPSSEASSHPLQQPPLSPSPTDMFLALWVFRISLFHK